MCRKHLGSGTRQTHQSPHLPSPPDVEPHTICVVVSWARAVIKYRIVEVHPGGETRPTGTRLDPGKIIGTENVMLLTQTNC